MSPFLKLVSDTFVSNFSYGQNCDKQLHYNTQNIM